MMGEKGDTRGENYTKCIMIAICYIHRVEG